ncbi:hypothetical protein [Streptomyces sp.]|uniref:hypothetical protein n=1 Tax=Streptomyces sp. TaxID=1931 RepID=UPI002F418471
MRLLPWSGQDGQPCYLSTGDDRGFVSLLADHLEARQLEMAEDLLTYVRAAVADGTRSETELRLLVTRLTEALRDTLRVAESRGDRLPPTDDDYAELSRAAQAMLDREMTR